MKIRYLVMDVDGTLTDGKIYMGANGEVCKVFNIKDGLGIASIAVCNGIIPIIITSRKSDIVMNRCKELGIENVQQGSLNKVESLKQVCSELSTVAYIGDDLNDLPPMKLIHDNGGVLGCPADAAKEIKDIVDFISSKNGGDGAVREFIEWIVRGEKQ